jgi:RNA polymerase sigma-70 factor (ECF subfamily)
LQGRIVCLTQKAHDDLREFIHAAAAVMLVPHQEPISMDLDPSVYATMLAAIPRLRAFAMSLCRDPDQADDLAQEALLRAWANVHRFETGSNMSAWLITILRNQYYTEYRKRRREVEDVDGVYAQSLAVEPTQLARLEHEELRAALAELPDDVRRALILVGAEGASYEQVAQACNCSIGTVKSRVHRARARLAERLSVDRSADRRESLKDRSRVVGENTTSVGTAAI